MNKIDVKIDEIIEGFVEVISKVFTRIVKTDYLFPDVVYIKPIKNKKIYNDDFEFRLYIKMDDEFKSSFPITAKERKEFLEHNDTN